MTTAATSALDALATHLQETALLQTTNNLLDWDQETTMPSGGLEWRARQQAFVARLVHERASSRERGDLIAAAAADSAVKADPALVALVREARRDYDKATKLP
ncbi:MAG: carboxypeptidase M32, partial [Planctomycetota bacterium]